METKKNDEVTFTLEQVQVLIEGILNVVNDRISDRIVSDIKADDIKHTPSSDATRKYIEEYFKAKTEGYTPVKVMKQEEYDQLPEDDIHSNTLFFVIDDKEEK